MSIIVESCWAPGCDALPRRTPEDVRGIVIHRIEVSQEDAAFSDTASDIARFFREHPIGVRATGGQMPYPLLITPDGHVSQTVPLGRVTPHARSHNPSTLGLALVGDFRCRPPHAAQYEALVAVLAGLLAELRLSADAIFAHDELAGGSADPNKECPGRHLPLARLRGDVRRIEHAATLPLVW